MLSHSAALEALLFAAGEPLSKQRLASILELSADELRAAALELHTSLQNRGLALIEVGTDLEIRTSPEASSVIKKYREGELSRDLGKASLETLAIILYKNGATRSEIEWIRGVNSAAALRSLTLRGLVERTEHESDRRRIMYLPTTEALAHLGVSHLSELPHYDELVSALKDAEEAKPVTE